MSNLDEKPILKNAIIIAIITHIVLAMTNIAMVATSIFIPRYLNLPEVKISDINVIADLHEISIESENHKDLKNFYPNKNLFSNTTTSYNCSSQFDNNSISPRCLVTIEQALNYKKAAAKKFIDENISEIDRLKALGETRDYSKDLYMLYKGDDQDILGSMLIAENFIEQPKRASFIGFISETRIRTTQRSITTHEDAIRAIDKALEELSSKAGKQKKVENVILSVTYHNSGHADSLLTPHAKIALANHSIPLLGTTYISEINDKIDFSEQYSILEKNSYKNILYIIDQDGALPKSIDILHQSMSAGTLAPISFSTSTSYGQVNYLAHLDFEEISLLDGSLSSAH